MTFPPWTGRVLAPVALTLVACGSTQAAPSSAGPVDACACETVVDAGAEAAVEARATYVIPFLSTPHGLVDGLSLNLSIGGGVSHEVLLDTGSEALLVPRAALGPNVTFPSPSQPFTLEYTSSGLTFTGEIVSASVVFGVASTFAGGSVSGLAETTPMPVRVVEAASCDPTYPTCQVPADLSTVGMLGVGFGRGTSDPSSNALLQVRDIALGAMTPGFVLSTQPAQLTIGVPASTDGFVRVALSPAANGDWLAASLQGCANMPELSWSLCGTLLMDTGLDYAILALPSGTSAPFDGGLVPDGTQVSFLSPFDGGALSDPVQLGATSLQTPPSVDLRRTTGTTPLINTGRRVMALYDYLFDARKGEVGFRPVGGG